MININEILGDMERPVNDLHRVIERLLSADFAVEPVQREVLYRIQENLINWHDKTKRKIRATFDMSKDR